MDFIKKHRIKIAVTAGIVIFALCMFFCGTNTTEEYAEIPEISNVTPAPAVTPSPEPEEINNETITVQKTAEPKVLTEEPVTDTAETPKKAELRCTLSVRCDNAVGKAEEKNAVIPQNGIILPETSVVFEDGESVFDVLVRTMKEHKIHLEFVNTPIYNSVYIEGINNLYEYDCGELSGWMYRVNGEFPNYGCSQYILKDGDKAEWVYTCDLGKDVGGEYSAQNGN